MFKRLHCYFIPRLLMTLKVIVFDIFLCWHTLKMYTVEWL